MRDGRGNKLSPEEQQKVKSIQGAPDKESLHKVLINPESAETGSADRPDAKRGKEAAIGAAE